MRVVVALALLLAPALLAAQETLTTPGAVSASSNRIYSGRGNRLDVDLPRAATTTVVTIDGTMDEPVWQTAAVLTGFSQFEPTDGLPAEDSTEVWVFYTDHAIFFGIRAFEPHGAVRAQLADRDKIDTDDNVQIYLDTFNDRRRSLYFAVNALGRQADGTRNERGGTSSTVDLAEDFQFQSKGRITDFGYEVEVRIPFKSLRYQALPVQDWGIQFLRLVQHSQYTQTWTPAKHVSQSFLAQSGRLKGLTQLKRGLVMDLNPTTTSHLDGTPAPVTTTRWKTREAKPELGGNVKWGITTNLTMNATANPDFSQVEADVQAVQYDPRSSVSYPEKRPFFVEGSEQFDAPSTPASLIYTRRMVQPVGALKLNGRAAGVSIGFLSAADERAQSAFLATPHNPLFNILRLKKDVGPQSTIGLTATDRTDGSNFSRVAAGDMRLVFSKVYSFTGNYAQSFNRVGTLSTTAPSWRFNLDRTGRRYGSSYNIQGTHPLFQTLAGFVSRTNLSTVSMDQKLTTYGKKGAPLESYTFDLNLSATFWYDSLLKAREWNDPKLHFNNTFAFRGGWRATTHVFLETFRYDPNLYKSYYIQRTLPGGAMDTVPYVGVHRIMNIDISQSLSTPQFSTFRGTFNVIWGWDENFEEWARAFIMFPTFVLTWNPSNKIRTELRYPLQLYVRLTDWSTVKRRQIPRLKVEYQASRAIFLRFVGQYDAQFRDNLRDASRTEFPILIKGSTGTFTPARLTRSNSLRVDWLFSYQPSPGTVFFAGYGASLKEPDPFRFTDLARTVDGFFVKLSYLYRL